MEPDFSKYSIEELEECLISIDRERYPERAAKIEKHLKALSAEETQRIEKIPLEQRKIIDKNSRYGSYLVIVVSLLFFILMLYTGEIPMRHSDNVKIEDDPIMFYFILVIFLFMAVWQALNIYIYRYKRKRE
ncbi:hypothetical protein KJY73_12820 [Bowmanella sp. Y26]|uniref:hypothetical protein n=1 Tax=Bowmanella yangjiangensis TaxID=2811230 RepID=UPI001BDD088B|nr:hypothetical protein [Bowmanella yangjiangensis]MBT1064464.1 hypothetical protein [Bowmanella yangjiangensis]